MCADVVWTLCGRFVVKRPTSRYNQHNFEKWVSNSKCNFTPWTKEIYLEFRVDFKICVQDIKEAFEDEIADLLLQEREQYDTEKAQFEKEKGEFRVEQEVGGKWS